MVSLGINSFVSQSIDSFYNLNDIFLSLNDKCNLLDTLPGTFILNFITNRLDEITSFKSLTKPISMVVRAVDASSLVMDISDLVTGLKTYWIHRDIYIIGKLIGKVSKVALQAYMAGWIDGIIYIITRLANKK